MDTYGGPGGGGRDWNTFVDEGKGVKNEESAGQTNQPVGKTESSSMFEMYS